jgi:PAS domain-containing protein
LHVFLNLEQRKGCRGILDICHDNEVNMSKSNARASSLQEPEAWELQDILTMALESSPHAVMLESEGRVTHANQAFAKLMQASSLTEIVGTRFARSETGKIAGVVRPSLMREAASTTSISW